MCGSFVVRFCIWWGSMLVTHFIQRPKCYFTNAHFAYPVVAYINASSDFTAHHRDDLSSCWRFAMLDAHQFGSIWYTYIVDCWMGITLWFVCVLYILQFGWDVCAQTWSERNMSHISFCTFFSRFFFLVIQWWFTTWICKIYKLRLF